MIESQDVSSEVVLGKPKATDDVVLRQPSAFVELFPSERTLYWKPAQATGDTSPAVSIVITQEVLLAVNEHVSQKPDRRRNGSRGAPEDHDGFVELGGFLLGNRYRCPNTRRDYIIIDCSSEARFTESTQSDLSFTPDTWAHFADEFDLKFKAKLLVGWYHSHPDAGVFLSNMDEQIHTERFADSWTTALVIDPVKQTGGFFCWKGGKLEPRQPVSFYEYLDHGSTESAVEWLNYKCADPKTGKELKPPKMSLDRARRRANAGRAQVLDGSAAVGTGRAGAANWRPKLPYVLGTAILTAVLLLALGPFAARRLRGLLGSSDTVEIAAGTPPAPTPEFHEEPNPLSSLELEINPNVRLNKAGKLELYVNLKPLSDNLVLKIDDAEAVLSPAPTESSYKLLATAEVPETVESLKKLPEEQVIHLAVLDRNRPELVGPTATLPLTKDEITRLLKGAVVKVKPPIVKPPPKTVSVPNTPAQPPPLVLKPAGEEQHQPQDAQAQQEQKEQAAPAEQQNPPEGAAKEESPKPVETPRQEPARPAETPRRAAEPVRREAAPPPEQRAVEAQQTLRPTAPPPRPPEDEKAMKVRQKRDKDELKDWYDNKKKIMEKQFKEGRDTMKAQGNKEGVKQVEKQHKDNKELLKKDYESRKEAMENRHKVEKKKFKDN